MKYNVGDKVRYRHQGGIYTVFEVKDSGPWPYGIDGDDLGIHWAAEQELSPVAENVDVFSLAEPVNPAPELTDQVVKDIETMARVAAFHRASGNEEMARDTERSAVRYALAQLSEVTGIVGQLVKATLALGGTEVGQ